MPTVQTESVFISTMIETYKRHEVMTRDKPGAFMQSDIDKFVHVKFEGDVALLLIKVDPKTLQQICITRTRETNNLY